MRFIAVQEGGFLIEGLAGARHFQKFDKADSAARSELCSTVRNLARAAGTSVQAVELKTEDKLSKAADGNQIFLGRTIYAKLAGRPDMVVKHQPPEILAVAN